MITLQLTTFERITLVNWVGQQKGIGLCGVRQWIKVLDVLELSESEKTAVGYVQHPNGQVMWKEGDMSFGIILEDAQFELLRPALDAEWSPNRRIVDMLSKIEAAGIDPK